MTIGTDTVILRVIHFQGYSSLSIALALPPTGRLLACDPEAHTLEMAKRFAERAGVAHKVQFTWAQTPLLLSQKEKNAAVISSSI